MKKFIYKFCDPIKISNDLMSIPVNTLKKGFLVEIFTFCRLYFIPHQIWKTKVYLVFKE